MKRRDFIATLAVGTAALAPRPLRARTEKPGVDQDNAWAVLVDTVVCIGCRKCEWACAREHKLTDKELPAFEDKSVFDRHRRPDATAYTVVNRFVNATEPKRAYTIKVQCMHCNVPACASACIVGALKKDPRGPVSYDAWKCIGCRYCMVACPFQIPAYEYRNALAPQVRKCTFCLERLEQRLKPACVAICPNEALTFGRRADLVELAHSRIIQSPGKYVDHVYGEREAGGTSWMYLAGADFINTELPKLADRPIPELTESIQHGIFRSFVPPLALYALLGLIMYSLREEKRIPGDQRPENTSHDA